MVTIITSVEDDFAYYNNLGYLRNGLANGNIAFQGNVNVFQPAAYVFHSSHTYHFTRTAKAKVREEMVAYLSDGVLINGVLQLPLLGFQQVDRTKLRGAFDRLFEFYRYKNDLTMLGQQRAESMQILVFNNQQYVAHITFSSTTTRNLPNQFTVNANLTCQRFSYFPLQQTNMEHVLQALQNLHVA